MAFVRGMVSGIDPGLLLQDDVELLPLRDGGLIGVGLQFSAGNAAHPRFMHEMILRTFWRVLAWTVAVRLPAARFDLAFECPRDAGSDRNVLPGEIRFEQPRSAFWFDADLLKLPIRRDEDVSTRVRLHLQGKRPRWPDLAINCLTTSAVPAAVPAAERAGMLAPCI